MDTKGSSQLTSAQMVRFYNWLRQVEVEEYARISDTVLHINTWGDGLVLVTSHAPKLAEFAIYLRNRFEQNNWKNIEAPQPIKCRIALHQGNVDFADDPLLRRQNVTGSAIITAARLEPVVIPGQVWASKEFVAASVAELSDNMKYVPLGKRDLAKAAGSIEVERLQLITEKEEPIYAIEGEVFPTNRFGELEYRWLILLTESSEKATWYVSGGDLRSVRKIIETAETSSGRLPKPLKVSQLFLRILSKELADRLVDSGLLDEDYYPELEQNLKAIKKMESRVGQVKINYWKGMPPFHGFAYRNVAHIGQWTVARGLLTPFSTAELFDSRIDEGGTLPWMVGLIEGDVP